ncbi:MAG TPA: SCO family protein [Oscillatoriaceae cyanobacterium]
MSRLLRLLALTILVLLASMPRARATAAEDHLLASVRFDQNLNAQVPLDAPFRDERGRKVTLGEFCRDRPVMLALVYFDCPNLCTPLLNAMTEAMLHVPLTAGRDFQFVAVSIDPRETPTLAYAKQQTYQARYGRGQSGLHFLTGDAASIAAVAEAEGFHYAYDAMQHQYAHPAGFVILTPQGRISRYFYGLGFDPTALRLSLVAASGDRIGSPVDQLLLRCCSYDPITGRYGLVIQKVLFIAGVGTALLLVVGIGSLLLLERRKRREGRA